MLKFAPDAEEPIEVPPLAAVYQRILFPAEVAFKSVGTPHAKEGGDAVTEEGADTAVPAVTVIAVLGLTVQPPPKASA
jgi:hypothetical protein